MAAFVRLGPSAGPSRGGEVLLSLLRMQAPSLSAGRDAATPGLCALRHLTATGKVALETALQLSVAVAMPLLYLAVTAGTRAWTGRHRKATSSSVGLTWGGGTALQVSLLDAGDRVAGSESGKRRRCCEQLVARGGGVLVVMHVALRGSPTPPPHPLLFVFLYVDLIP